MDTSDPKVAFDRLKDQYGGKSGETLILITVLATARLDSSKRIEEHYNEMLALRMKLSKLGSTMANEAFLAYLLASLPEKYDVFVSSVDITMETPVSVLTRLKVIEQRQAQRGNGPTGTALASVRNTTSVKAPKQGGSDGQSKNNGGQQGGGGGRRKGKGRGRGQGRGRGCGGGGNSDQPRPPPACYNCGGPHYLKECPNKHPNSIPQQQDTTFATPQAKPTGQQFTAVRGTALKMLTNVFDMTWYIDSGASDHFTPSKDDLCDVVRFPKPQEIQLGKGVVHAYGTGMLHFRFHATDGEDVNATIEGVCWVPGMQTRLLSFGALQGAGFRIDASDRKGLLLTGRDGSTSAFIPKVENVYPFKIAITPTASALASTARTVFINDDVPAELPSAEMIALAAQAHQDVGWYDMQCLTGHLNMRDVERLVKGAALATPLTTTEPLPKHTDCAACIGGKASRKPHSGG